MEKLETFAELSADECFKDSLLRLEVILSLVPVLEQRHENGEVDEGEWWEVVFQLGRAHMWMSLTL